MSFDISQVFVAGFSGNLPSTMTVLKRNDTVVNKDAIYRFPKVSLSSFVIDSDDGREGTPFPRTWFFLVKGTLGSGLELELSINKLDGTWETLETRTILTANQEEAISLVDEIFNFGYEGSPNLSRDNNRFRLRGRSVSSTTPASNVDIEFFTRYSL